MCLHVPVDARVCACVREGAWVCIYTCIGCVHVCRVVSVHVCACMDSRLPIQGFLDTCALAGPSAVFLQGFRRPLCSLLLWKQRGNPHPQGEAKVLGMRS